MDKKELGELKEQPKKHKHKQKNFFSFPFSLTVKVNEPVDITQYSRLELDQSTACDFTLYRDFEVKELPPSSKTYPLITMMKVIDYHNTSNSISLFLTSILPLFPNITTLFLFRYHVSVFEVFDESFFKLLPHLKQLKLNNFNFRPQFFHLVPAQALTMTNSSGVSMEMIQALSRNPNVVELGIDHINFSDNVPACFRLISRMPNLRYFHFGSFLYGPGIEVVPENHRNRLTPAILAFEPSPSVEVFESFDGFSHEEFRHVISFPNLRLTNFERGFAI